MLGSQPLLLKTLLPEHLCLEAFIWFSFWRALKFQSFNWRVGSNPRRQSKNTKKWTTKLTLNLCRMIWYMLPVQCEESRINHPTPLLVVTSPYARRFLWRADHIEDFKWRRLHFAIWGCVLKRCCCCERGIFLKGHTAFEGHWRLQSWTPAPHSKSRSWMYRLPRTKMDS